MNEALLPCPFCGSTKLHTEDVRDFISCLGCGAEGPFRMGQGSESSVEAWNKRAALHADQARDARIQALEEAGEACEGLMVGFDSGGDPAYGMGFSDAVEACAEAIDALAQATQPVPGGKELP